MLGQGTAALFYFIFTEIISYLVILLFDIYRYAEAAAQMLRNNDLKDPFLLANAAGVLMKSRVK